jgi:hypothetical protein
MSYQKNYNFNPRQNQNYSRPSGGYQGMNYNQNQQQRKKHSGAVSGVSKKDGLLGSKQIPFVRGWNYSKAHGLVSFFAAPYGKTSAHKSKTSGKMWENWMVKVSPKMAKPFIVSGLYDQMSGKVIINELGMVLNPKAPNGGYCGKFGGK